ncbi:hypothetical protein [Levilactobacillus spicheri]|jgi:hypothetical protein|uniref:Uncharacterized protein n=2 Tax=Levilactobacillus spicheri TaxID=216463 RepID=A0A0F3RR52_9LACO|nr:hypothetical protein [Levilactobacillus spicheri]KJW12355.1 hypothetical protein VC81_07520 [Levilactobacillus spicheri]KRL48873.1 hypothetical protein FD37_GL001341 [Levilactobacillus spicheri DSM 15429]GEO67815.1 hypothetical protein LSP04_22340 [Levilactobacillus spicheri]
MQIGFNRHFYRSWPFWVGLGFLIADAVLRWWGWFLNDPLGVMIGILWLLIGLFLTPGGHPHAE